MANLLDMLDAIEAYMQTCTQGPFTVRRNLDIFSGEINWLVFAGDDLVAVCGIEQNASLICALLNAAGPIVKAARRLLCEQSHDEHWYSEHVASELNGMELAITPIYNALVTVGAIKEQ